MMMTISFITLYSSLVPLIEGLCSSIIYEFEFLVSRSHFLLYSKICQRKKAVSPRSYPISQHTYKPLYIVRMFENIYAEISPSRFFGPSECLVPTPWLTSEYPTCNVRVCAYTHTYTHVHSHHRQKIEKIQTTPLFFLI